MSVLCCVCLFFPRWPRSQLMQLEVFLMFLIVNICEFLFCLNVCLIFLGCCICYPVKSLLCLPSVFSLYFFSVSMEWDPRGFPPPPAGYREGFLWKRGRDNGQYLNRKFILSEREGVLKYFNKHDVSVFSPSFYPLNLCLICSSHRLC